MIFINFKTYQQGTGAGALSLAQTLQEVADETHLKVVPVVQAADVKEVTSAVHSEVWVQKIDPIDYGAHTGAVLPEAVFEDGAMGTFLNHSEAKFSKFADLETAVKRCREVGLKTLIFAANLAEIKKVLKLKPTFLAYEPPELVGSKETSVAREKPEVIAKAVKIAREESLPLIVGAGIKGAPDVKKSLELGAAGVAVASDVVVAKDPRKELMELISGFE